MKLVTLLLFCSVFLSNVCFSQVNVVLTTGDTAKGVSIEDHEAFYILTTEDESRARISKSIVKTVIDESDILYCQIVGYHKFLSRKVTVAVDYGEDSKLTQDKRIKDGLGNPKSFNSMIDALNYMARYGWKFVQAYTITTGDQNVYHYLLKKEMK